MNNRLSEQVMSLPVWDTHNHLEGSAHLCAQSFWDVGHYFWFHRELQGVGYPGVGDAMAMPERDRAEAFAKAFAIGRNTTWNQMVRRTLKDLWDVEITDAKSVLAAGGKIAATGGTSGWARDVCDRVNIRTITVTRAGDNGMQEIEDKLCLMGAVSVPEAEEILAKPDAVAAAAEAAAGIEAQVAAAAAAGRRVIRSDVPSSARAPELSRSSSAEDIADFLRHAVLAALDKHRCQVQVYVGMEYSHPPGLGESGPIVQAVNDPARVAGMHALFARYPGCAFEIFNAASLSNMDIVQAARIFPNVIPGGLWWFNFRASTYRQTMQYRLEALPATRCTLLASDARCIEWLYCKTLLVKRLLAGFLREQVESGWLDEETCLYAAREWLHDAPARLYASESHV